MPISSQIPQLASDVDGREANKEEQGEGDKGSHCPKHPHCPHLPSAIKTQVSLKPTFVLVAIVLALFALYVLRTAITPLVVAFFIAYLLNPVVDGLEKIGILRGVGAVVVVLGSSLIVLISAAYFIPMFIQELSILASDLPSQLNQLYTKLGPSLEPFFKIKIPRNSSDIGKIVAQRLPQMMNTVEVAFFETLNMLRLIFDGLLVLVLSTYLLVDFRRIVWRLNNFVPLRFKTEVSETANLIHSTLGRYVRGQLLASLTLAGLYSLALSASGIRLAVSLGILTGLLSFIPYLGFAFGLVITLAISILDWHGFSFVVWVLCLMFIVHIVDIFVVTPKIVGQSVGLDALEVLITMMTAGALFGTLGVFLAVPIGAVIKILGARFEHYYLKSSVYTDAT